MLVAGSCCSFVVRLLLLLALLSLLLLSYIFECQMQTGALFLWFM